MNVTWLHSGPDGESHFTDLVIPDTAEADGGAFTDFIASAGVSWRASSAGRSFDFHPAPRRQFVIVTQGHVEVEVAGGDKRVFGPGEVFLADDTAGHGHQTRNLDDGLRAWVSVDKSLDVGQWVKR